MLLQVFTIRDQAGEFYNPPFFAKTKQEAVRSFTRIKNDPQSTINQFPQHFDLYEIGTFDDSDGKMVTFDTPQHIIAANNLTAPETV